jgi:hypothetical protein
MIEKIQINFSLKRKEMTVQEYINYCKYLISHLQMLDNMYKKASIMDVESKKIYFFNDNLSDFNFENLSPVINKKDISYLNENFTDNNMTVNSKSWAGFSLVVFFGNQHDINEAPDIGLSISQGSYDDATASIKFEYSEKEQYKLTKEYIIRLMELVSQIVDVKFANAITGKFFLKVRQKGKNSVGWINYTENKNIINYLSKTDVCRIFDNGVIFSISDKCHVNDDKTIINKSIEISNILSLKK